MASIIGITIEQTRAAEHGSTLAAEGWPDDARPIPPRPCGHFWRTSRYPGGLHACVQPKGHPGEHVCCSCHALPPPPDAGGPL